MKKQLLFVFATFSALLASAQTKVEIDGIWYNLITKSKVAEVTYKGSSYDEYYDEYSGSITIPATVTHEGKEYSVTSIESGAFRNCRSLTAINIPESVTSIGVSAFCECSSLTAINIPEGVTSIEDDTFYNCTSLKSITIPEDVTSIGSQAFSYCHSLTAITVAQGNTKYDSRGGCNAIIETNSNTLIAGCSTTIIPESVTSIGDKAFCGCRSLTAITIPESVTSIGVSAFHQCSSLTAITIPESVTSIGSSAFYYCESLTAIIITEGSQLTSIGEMAFYGCESLTAIIIPESVTSVGDYAFTYCHSLTAITISENSQLTSIGDWGFTDCSSLTAITIPESVTSIGDGAFYGCSTLTTIVLPKNLKIIYSHAFANCGELLDVYCYTEEVPSTKSDAFDGSYPEYITLHVPASALNAYKSTAPWSSFGNIVELGAAITRITLDKTSTILTEGEELTINITTTPSNADRNLISWSSNNPSVATVDNTGKVTAVAPGAATITAMANDGSGVSASCEVIVNELILGTCATPTISYEDGKILLACDTEGAIIKSITAEDCAGEREEGVFNIIPTYTITAYATKEKYEDSDVATLTICWVPCEEKHESEETGILTIPSKPVFISTQGGTITVSGLAADTEVAAYDTAGTQLATTMATAGTATLTTNLTTGDIAIVKIGEHSIKVVIK